MMNRKTLEAKLQSLNEPIQRCAVKLVAGQQPAIAHAQTAEAGTVIGDIIHSPQPNHPPTASRRRACAISLISQPRAAKRLSICESL